MRNYYRMILGRKSQYAEECFANDFIGVDFDIHEDVSQHLPEEWRDFNKHYIPVFLSENPDRSKISAGLACGGLWTLAKGIHQNDIVLCSDGAGNYSVAEVISEYFYKEGLHLPHRRKVRWLDIAIPRASMSEALRNSSGSVGTMTDLRKYGTEIEKLISSKPEPANTLIVNDNDVEDPLAFAMEEHLESFLVMNWQQTELGKNYNIFEEEGEKVGRQYQTDTGPIDILAVSKDRKELLVVELKRGRASDVVVGQIQRYMGFVQDELAEPNQIVKGIIIAFEDDVRIRRALSVANNIEFYRYQISFNLVKD